eukprot:NODE_6092_length_1706_cov_11.544649.p1 GENE.NODE_6092_length_1706_cov_11.544649~~NODE_6092_length_1706_cov_11.544649.p1  ORF type:complete len:419 (-),score=83.56 NODE_6092_length_1706_cov_11.544649:222-1478(-)
MVPGCVAEQYTPEQTQIHLEPLARWGGIRYINALVIGIDTVTQTVRLAPSPFSPPDGGGMIPEMVHYDVISFDIGCRTAHTETPGVAELAIPTRPIHLLVHRMAEKIACYTRDAPMRLVVCGAGAAGIELAMTGAVKVRKAGKVAEVTLVSSSEELSPNDPPVARRMVEKAVRERGITVVPNCVVARVTESEVVLSDGNALAYDMCLWTAGAAAHKLAAELAACGIPTTDHGWIRVANTLQSIAHPNIFAAGDCCYFEHKTSQPFKAGVYAVRTGPVLINNLLNYLRAEPLVEYNPQPEFLRLINCGDGYAVGIRFRMAFYGPWVWAWKDFIDQWFMNLFKEENLPDLAAMKKASGGEQFDSALRRSFERAPDDAGKAAAIILSEDADLAVIKDIINRMAAEDAYCECVVGAYYALVQ